MSDSAFTFDPGRGLAMARAMEAMLRTLGAGEVALRFAVPGSETATDARLGLANNAFEDVTIAPVSVRAADRKAGETGKVFEFLFPGSLVQQQIELRQVASAEAFFESLTGIVHRDQIYRIVEVSSDLFAGTPYLFRVVASE